MKKKLLDKLEKAYFKKKEYMQKYYRDNKDILLSPEKRAYIKKWAVENKTKVRKYMKDYYQNHREELLLKAVEKRSKLDPEKQKEYMREYYLNNKSKLNKWTLNYYHNTPGVKNKYRVRKIARRKYKILPMCQICKKEPAINRHHLDYDKPLEVIFCCDKCHRDIHRKYK